jgi:transposase
MVRHDDVWPLCPHQDDQTMAIPWFECLQTAVNQREITNRFTAETGVLKTDEEFVDQFVRWFNRVVWGAPRGF